MKAIAYIRCSTQEQADSGLGMEAQTQRIRAYCTMRDIALTEIVTDAGVSGGKPLATRPGGLRLLANIRKGRIQAVVMLKLDRMFRNAGDCLSTIEGWEKQGVALHVVDLGGNAIDTTSAAGRFMLVVLAGAAEMERNLIRERTRSAMAVMRANGQRVGTIPFGFDLAGDGIGLNANESERAIVAQILEARSNGQTLQQIADDLTARSIPTKTGRSTVWSHQAVASILKREGQPGARGREHGRECGNGSGRGSERGSGRKSGSGKGIGRGRECGLGREQHRADVERNQVDLPLIAVGESGLN